MTPLSLLCFAAALFMLAISPGPGVLATVARALSCGFGPAAIMVLGIIVGDLIFLLLAIYGLSAMAVLLGSFFSVIKYGGGLYLIWMGLKIWRSPPPIQELHRVQRLPRRHYLGLGLAISLANPKVILFYLGFLPTLVDLKDLRGLEVVTLALVLITVLGGVLLSYAWTASRLGPFLHNKMALRGINRCAAGIMAGAGCAILLKD